MPVHEQKVELLRKIDIFSSLREYELDILAQYSEYVKIKKGQALFTPGRAAGELYVVETGLIGIISMEKEDDVVIAQIAPGESFGELDFIGRTARRSTALADEDSVLLKFPAANFALEEIIREHGFISARILYRLLGIISERIWNVTRLIYDKTPWIQDLHRQLLSDKITGLYNATYLKEDFVTLLPDLGEDAALLMIKPDNFKEVNDRFGHKTGDQMLNYLAIFLQSELGEHDIGVRYRGDEFAAILINTGKERAVRRAGEIGATFKALDLSGITGDAGFRITVSIGIALYPLNSSDSATLVGIAHVRMLHGRDLGGDSIII